MMGRKAQSILEYVIILAAIVAAIIYGARQYIQPAVEKVFYDSGEVIDTKSLEFLNKAGGGYSDPSEGDVSR
jgi:ABC-type uncharacterized transport system permease subunit